MNELQLNSKNNLISTVECFSSVKEQLEYKKTVPFVHIPYELICQWDGSFIKGQSWFREIWTDSEWNELNKFDKVFNEICKNIPDNDFVDIPEALKNELWITLIERSKELLSKLDR